MATDNDGYGLYPSWRLTAQAIKERLSVEKSALSGDWLLCVNWAAPGGNIIGRFPDEESATVAAVEVRLLLAGSAP